MLTNIQIAQNCQKKHILEISGKLDIADRYIEQYGNFKAKIDYRLLEDLKNKKDGKLILVTAITPTAAGEGKTTTTIGLADALTKLGKRTILTLREPSLGPVFGIKGGAAGGGYAQVVPMEDINLHFTGDLHAVSAANNLLAAMIDNHIQQGNHLNIDPRKISWKRAVDINDRQLRKIVCGLGGRSDGTPREDGFDITAASEIMAILCLSKSISDLKQRLGNITIGYTYDNIPVKAEELKVHGAMAALLKDALKPNLVQTLEATPAFIHGGPFANIAHGCNSIMATKLALKLADYTVTEAGFGADLGAEKFLDIKCRIADLKPDAAVIVTTCRALKNHGGAAKDTLNQENLPALEKGLPNLLQHIDNIQKVFKLPAVVAINRFPSDTEAELKLLAEKCRQLNIPVALSEVFFKGSDGGIDLAREVIRLAENENKFEFAYDLSDSIYDKLNKIATRIYHADKVELTTSAFKQLQQLENMGFSNLPVCIAKTQYSFSDDPKKLAVPKDFVITVRELKVSSGAGFIVALTGDIMTMPGLPKVPSAENIDIDNEGIITGLF
jgi:formate--tetrahydrofolate ligase